MILKITNTTSKNFEQHYSFQGVNKHVIIPKYALMHEIQFVTEEERNLFLKLIQPKLDLSILCIGKMSEGDAQKTSKKVKEKEGKNKEKIVKEKEKDLDKEIKTEIGTDSVLLKTEISKK